MAFFGGILVLLSPVVLLLGLVFPRIFAKRGEEKPKRMRGVGYGVLLFVVGFALAVIFDRDDLAKSVDTAKSTPPADAPPARSASTTPVPPSSAPASPTAPAIAEAPKAAATPSPVAQGAVSAPQVPSSSAPSGAAPINVADYLAKCHKAAEATYNADCLGKTFTGALFFMSPDADQSEQLMAVPGHHSEVVLFSVGFTSAPAWGDRGPMAWTGRRETISATISAQPASGKAVKLTDARIVANDDWRRRAVEIAKERGDVLEAMWPQENVGGSFWVVMPSTGQSRDFDARQICGDVWKAGRPGSRSVVVTILDAARMQQQAVIGKALCQ